MMNLICKECGSEDNHYNGCKYTGEVLECQSLKPSERVCSVCGASFAHHVGCYHTGMVFVYDMLEENM